MSVFAMLPGQEQQCVFTMLTGDVSRSQATEVEVYAEEDQHGQRNHGDGSRTLCQTTAKSESWTLRLRPTHADSQLLRSGARPVHFGCASRCGEAG